jgi:hypothetical protein
MTTFQGILDVCRDSLAIIDNAYPPARDHDRGLHHSEARRAFVISTREELRRIVSVADGTRSGHEFKLACALDLARAELERSDGLALQDEIR